MKAKLSAVLMALCVSLFILNTFVYADEVDDLISKLLHAQDWHDRYDAAIQLGKIKDPRAVEPLIKALGDYWKVREAAKDALVKIGKPAVEPLIKALLEDSYWEVRIATAKALGEIKDPRAVEPLIKALKDAYWDVRVAAKDALVKIGKPAVEPLIKALGDSDGVVRRDAARALGEIKDPRAVEPLIKALQSDDFYVRKAAAQALGEIKDPRAVEPLIKALGDSYGVVRVAAKDALVKIGKPAVEPLIKALGDSDGVVRRDAARALGEIKDPRAIEVLKEVIINDDDLSVRQAARDALYAIIDEEKLDKVEKLIFDLRGGGNEDMVSAAKALGEIKDPRAVEPLIKALGDSYWDVRKAAKDALVKIGKPAIELLIKALGDSDGDVREAAKDALVKIGKPAVEPLIKALRDVVGGVRAAAAEALGEIKDPRAVEPLIEALEDNEWRVRAVAAWALGEIKDPRAVEPLIKTLGDVVGGIRESAAWALGEIKDPRAVEPLIKALQSDDSLYVRKAAAQALGEIKDPRAVEPLIKALGDSYGVVRGAAKDALVKIGKPAVEPLIKALEDNEWRVRADAARALGEIKDPRAIEVLKEVIINDDDLSVRQAARNALYVIIDEEKLDKVEKLIFDLRGGNYAERISAAQALGEIKDPRAVEPLSKALLEDSSDDVREATARALGEIKDPRAVEPLIKALGDEDGDVRGAAARALGEIKDPRAVEPLIKALFTDESPDVRNASGEALIKIKGETAQPLVRIANNTKYYFISGQLLDENGEPVRFALMKFNFPREYYTTGGGTNWSGDTYSIEGGEITTITDANGKFLIVLPQKWVQDRVLFRNWGKSSVQMRGKSFSFDDIDLTLNINSNTDIQSIAELLNTPEFMEYARKYMTNETDITLNDIPPILFIFFKNPHLKRLADIVANWDNGSREIDALEFIIDELSYARKHINETIKCLDDKKDNVNEFAFHLLILIGQPAIEPLQEFIKSGEGSEEAIELAKKALQELGAEIPETVVKQPEEPQIPTETVQTGEKSTEELLTDLSSEDKNVVLNAIQTLGERKEVRAVEPILGLLGRDDKEIRDASKVALEKILLEIKDERLKSVASGVLDLLKAETADEKVSAIEQLGALKDIRALPILIRTLEEDGSKVRLSCLNAIVGFGKPALEILEQYKGDEKVGGLVASAIEMIEEDIKIAEEKRKEEILGELKSGEKEKVLSAIEEVKKENLLEAAEPLLALLGDRDEEIRNNAREALAQLSGYIEDESLKALVENAIVLSNPDSSKQDKLDAIDELGKLHDIRAVDVLARTLAEEDIDIKLSALGCLVKMGNEVVEPLQKYVEDPEISDEVQFILTQVSYEDNQTEYAVIPPQEENTPDYGIEVDNSFCVDFDLDNLL